LLRPGGAFPACTTVGYALAQSTYGRDSEGGNMEGIAKLISASAWALVALTLAAGIPFAWRRVLAWIDAKSQVAMAEAVRRMIEE
jgi:hypothetical protein